MNCRIAVTILMGVFVRIGAAQTPIACAGQLIPLKPPAVFSCSTAAPVCIANQNGRGGHWVWGCPAESTPESTSAANQPDWQKLLQGPPPPVRLNDPMDTAIKVQQLRLLQLQNQQAQRDLAERERAAQSIAVAPPSQPAKAPVSSAVSDATGTDAAGQQTTRPFVPDPVTGWPTAGPPSVRANPQPGAEAVQALQAVYACGMLDATLQNAVKLGLTEAAAKIRKDLEATACDKVRQIIGAKDPQ
jgi:hypothetical protein